MAKQPNTQLHSAVYAVVFDGSEDVDFTDGYGNYSQPPVALVTAVAGTIDVEWYNGEQTTLPSVQNGYRWDVQPAKILSTSTSTSIVALWNRKVFFNDGSGGSV